MEASALTHASRSGLLARRSPVLKLERDERLVALIRAGHDRAFEVMVDRYQSRLLAFCSSMLTSRQDAEDVMQEVFVNAHRAMLADERKINLRPWLYRIARNRCLNHLRRAVPEGQDSMDIHPHLNGTTTAERVQKREELRQLLDDVGTLPETQRTALLLREIDQMSYDEIAVAMETTIPAVKSLLVRARITLAESSESRTLSCDEVRLSLAEAAEGIAKASGAVRIHVKNCEGCADFRSQLRADRKALAAILPIGPLALLKTGLLAKLFGSGGAATGGAATGGVASTTAVSAAAGTAAAGGTATAAGGIGGAIGGAIGTKAVAGVATAAILTAGAVEVSQVVPVDPTPVPIERAASGGPSKGPDSERKFARKLLTAAGSTASATTAVGTETAAADEPETGTDPDPAEDSFDGASGEGEATEAERGVSVEPTGGNGSATIEESGKPGAGDGTNRGPDGAPNADHDVAGGPIGGPAPAPEPDPAPPGPSKPPPPSTPPPGDTTGGGAGEGDGAEGEARGEESEDGGHNEEGGPTTGSDPAARIEEDEAESAPSEPSNDA